MLVHHRLSPKSTSGITVNTQWVSHLGGCTDVRNGLAHGTGTVYRNSQGKSMSERYISSLKALFHGGENRTEPIEPQEVPIEPQEVPLQETYIGSVPV